MNEKLNDQDVLLVKEKGSAELNAANIDKDGKLKTTAPDERNPDFLKIDRNSNVLENFFENFMRQAKDPTRFEFFRVPMEKFQEVIQKLQDAFRNPDKPENKEFIDMHRVEPKDFLKKEAQTQEQPKAKEFAINPDLVNWEKFERYGINREKLEKSGDLVKLLDYQKTGLVPVSIRLDGEMQPFYTDGRFSLRKQEDGTFSPAVHLIRHKPDLERPYFGIKFTEEDKQNLLKTGNLGRIVEAEFKQGEKTPILLSLDKLTNELIAFRKEWLKVPDTYKGVQLNEEQKRELGEGKAVRVEDMTSSKGTKFSADVQFNADKRYFELIFDNNKKQEQSQKEGDIPKTFRKKELTEDQRSSLGEGKTVKIEGLKDKKGEKYSGYITLNKETGKTDFIFPKDYKDALAAGKVIPDDRHKTQVATNSEGKTNEATKNLKEPLKQGQTAPDEKQVEKEEREKKKSKGVKM
jgi:hypothetical protein